MSEASRAEDLQGRPLVRWLALADVAAGALAAAEAELVLIGGQQAECAAAIGRRLHDLPGAGGETADHLPEVVAALQTEDAIRQHQEQIGRLLGRLRAAVLELAAATPAAVDGAERQRLAESLVADIPLAGFRRRLEDSLNGIAAEGGVPEPVGDIELF